MSLAEMLDEMSLDWDLDYLEVQKRDEVKMHTWQFTIRNGGESEEFLFHCGLGWADENGPKPPTLANLVECLIDDVFGVQEAGSFEDWAMELGMDPDSRSAERMYDEIAQQHNQLKALFGDEELERMREQMDKDREEWSAMRSTIDTGDAAN